MSNKNSVNEHTNEKIIEHDNRNAYNDALSGKIEPQNKHHNARKEGFARKERQQNN